MGKPIDLVQGTLDFLILKAIDLEPKHGWGIAKRIQQISGDVLKVPQGSLYPALYRLERQGWIAAARRAGRLRPAGQVLLAHAVRSRPPQEGNRDVGSVVGSHQSRDPGDVGASRLRDCANDALVLRRAVSRPLAVCTARLRRSARCRSAVSPRAGNGRVRPRRTVTRRLPGARPESLRQSGGRDGRRARDVRCGPGGNGSVRIFATPSAASGAPRPSPPRRCCRSPSGSARRRRSSAFSIPWCCDRFRFVIRPTLFQVVHSGDGGPSESSTYALYEHLRAHAKTIAGTFQVNPTSTMRVHDRRPSRCRRRAAGHGRLLQRAGHPAGHRERDRAARRAGLDA